MQIKICNECKIIEAVKRPGQLPKMICRVTGDSIFVAACPHGLSIMDLAKCLFCKMSEPIKRPNDPYAKLECSVLRTAIKLANCVEPFYIGRFAKLIERVEEKPIAIALPVKKRGRPKKK